MKAGARVGKIARRLGITPTRKTIKVVSRRSNAPGVHGAKRRSSKSVFSQQLIEKQKLRFQFMVSEKTLRRAFAKARGMRGSTGENLVKLLDERLDATIFRSGIVASVPAARQLISHRHVFVNGTRVYSPSYRLTPGDLITFSDKAKKFALLNEGFLNAQSVPYVELDREQYTIKRTLTPERNELPVQCNDQMIVEWYSR